MLEKAPKRMDDRAQIERTEAFLRATQGPGKPMIYGTGKPPEKKEKS